MTDIEYPTNFHDYDPEKSTEWHDAAPAEIANDVAPSWSGPAEPGSFPEYDEYTIESPAFPPPELVGREYVSPDVHDIFEGGNLEHQWIAPAELRSTGVPSRTITAQQVLDNAAPRLANNELLYQGSGILLGYTAFLTGTPATTFMALTDSLDGNGPVLAIINTAAILTGFVSVGQHGIRFRTGLTLTNIQGNVYTLLPILERHIPTVHAVQS